MVLRCWFTIINAILLASLTNFATFTQAQDSTAQDNPCTDTAFLYPNASISVSISGLNLNAKTSYPGGIWTLGTAISQINNYTTNTTETLQHFWLKTDPVITDSSESLPFGGCIFPLRQDRDERYADLRLNNRVRPADASGNCSRSLPKRCYEALNKQFRDGLRGALYPEVMNNKVKICKDIWPKQYPKGCDNIFSPLNTRPYGPFGMVDWPVSGAGLNLHSDGTCNRTSSSVLNGSMAENGYFVDTSRRLLVDGDKEPAIGNDTYYDFMFERTTAIFLVTWSRTGGAGFGIDASDVQSVCLRAGNRVVEGSRDPGRIPNAGLRDSEYTGGYLVVIGVAAIVLGLIGML